MKLKIIKSILFPTIGVLSTNVVTPVVLSSCGKQKQKTIPVNSVSLDTTQLELVEGQTTKLIATVLPEDATNKKVTWSSSDEFVAIVDQKGKVTAKNPGTATITATTEDGGYTATCKVTVTEKIIPVTGVTLDRDKLELVEGRVAKLVASILPTNATNKNVTWSSLKPSIAIVDQSGFVTAKAPGNVEIAVTTEDGWHIATCKVTVTKSIVPVTGVKLDKDKLELIQDDTPQLIATVLPEDATNKNVIWGTSAPSVATVDKNGNIKAISEGTATITVTTKDGGYTATCIINVVNKEVIPVRDVTISESSLDLPFAWEHQLTATVLPENAANKNVSWSSSNESIATVDQNGKVTAKSLGTATVTVTTEDGNKTATCDVTVKEYIPVENVEINESTLDLPLAWEHQLTATILPWNANNRGVTWTSSNEFVATVDSLTGKVTAKNPGTTTITVTTWDGLKTDTCEVTVKEHIPVESVEINESTLDLPLAWEHQLTATILPWNANNRGVTWTSSDESVATVDQNGNVKAISEGTTTITVTTWDGLKSDTCEVTVKEHIPVESVEINESTLDLVVGDHDTITATILPWNANNRGVTWTSSNEFVATVDSLTGKVTAKNPGTTTITVTTWDGLKSDTCEVTVTSHVVVGTEHGRWGDITVKYKLLSNYECCLLTKFNGEDSENGYVDGTGVLRIPDHVVYNGENYYVRKIPSEWSDGSNNVDGIEFAGDVSHLKEICDYAFKNTDALNNYHQKFLTFPEGLKYIGTEAFCNVDRSNDNVMYGIDFPSTLISIGKKAFANAGRFGNNDNFATIMFRGNFNTANMREEVFSPFSNKHFVQYIYAPTIEIATNIANYIKTVYEQDFMKADYSGNNKVELLIPKSI